MSKRFKRIHIEISNVCNLQCNFCPEVLRQKTVMQEPLFRKIVAQAAPLADELSLHLMGEPLGHPNLSAFIDICAGSNAPVNLTTNGTLLDAARTEVLLHRTVRQVNFSLHSFEANFGERDVTGYLRKIFAFTHAAFERRPDLYINFRLWDLTSPNELSPTNAKMRAAISDEFKFSFDDLNIDLRRRKSFRILNRLYLHFDSRFEWPSPDAPIRSSSGTCHALSSHFGIHADGTVVACCLDKEANLALGNAETQSLEAILMSPRAQSIVMGFANNQCVEALCQRCDYIKRFDQKKPRARSEAQFAHALNSLSQP